MNPPRLNPEDPPADVTLLLEGSYPLVRGGVASWVHQLITGLPSLRFAAVFVGGAEDEYQGLRYELPPNLVHLELHYLLAGKTTTKPAPRQGCPAAFNASDELHQYFKSPTEHEGEYCLKSIASLLEQPGGLNEEDFLYSQQAWEQIVEYYQRYCTNPSFIDYFWNVRNIHAPLFLLADIAKHLPPTRCLHSISTGYAGFIGALAQQLHNVPFLLTEHGIYTKERRIELMEVEWIKTPQANLGELLQHEVDYVRHMWQRFFEGLGRLCYVAADSVTTLYENNRLQQIRDGAYAERTQVIPNGIDVQKFSHLRARHADNRPPIIGFLGRITPIKDIKTLIRSMHTVCTRMPTAEVLIAGPEDEDPEYAEECKALVERLGLKDRIHFLGFQKTEEILGRISVLVLSSISEAQPLVLLEAMAAGVPVVATDVGACQELLYGKSGTGHDPQAVESMDARMSQACGYIVPITNAESMANAVLKLLRDSLDWQRAHDAGIRRVDSEYTQELMFDRYWRLYEDTMRADADRKNN